MSWEIDVEAMRMWKKPEFLRGKIPQFPRFQAEGWLGEGKIIKPYKKPHIPPRWRKNSRPSR